MTRNELNNNRKTLVDYINKKEGVFILVVGFSGSGKSTFVENWGNAFGWKYYLPDDGSDLPYDERYSKFIKAWDKKGIAITEGVLSTAHYRKQILDLLPNSVYRVGIYLYGGLNRQEFQLPTKAEGFDEICFTARFT